MPSLRVYFRRWRKRPKLRPWALVAPVIVLSICLPRLRPLRHAGEPSGDEQARLATVRALVEHRTLVLDPEYLAPRSRLIRVNQKLYSDQPPVMAVLLSGPYWLITRFHVTLQSNALFAAYLLTLIGATLPVAAAGA